jgi:50S ribosomal subunit-associated GTPase HflX
MKVLRDLLVHVIDCDFNVNIKFRWWKILEQLGAADKPKIYVFNKIDNCVRQKEERRLKIPNLSPFCISRPWNLYG